MQAAGKTSRRVVCVTGFGPFGDVGDNPSAHLALALDGLAIGGAVVAAAVWPVDARALAGHMAWAYARQRPIAALHLGVARRARALQLEARARNALDFRLPDATGWQPTATAIDPGAVAERAWGLAEQCTAALVADGQLAMASHDAGTYVCNLALWRMIDMAPCPALFAHVPADGGSEAIHEAAIAAIAWLVERAQQGDSDAAARRRG